MSTEKYILVKRIFTCGLNIGLLTHDKVEKTVYGVEIR